MSYTYVLPLALVVVSNIVYHICAKSVPDRLDPLASLTVTYAVGAVISGLLYCILSKGSSLLQGLKGLNWAPFVLGIAIVGLEAGYIYAYKAGWAVSTASIVQSAFLAIALIAVGFFLYRETISWSKLIGILICLIGLVFINK